MVLGLFMSMQSDEPVTNNVQPSKALSSFYGILFVSQFVSEGADTVLPRQYKF